MSDNGKAREMKDALVKDLKEHKWNYRVKELKDGRWAIDTDVISRSDVFKSYEIRLVCDKWDMTVVIYNPIKAPAKTRGEVAAYLNRINWSTRFGKNIMDSEDGEIRTEIIFLPSSVINETSDIAQIAFCSVRDTLDDYAQGLLEVVSGLKTASQAFDDARKAVEADDAPVAEPPPPPPPPVESAGEGAPQEDGAATSPSQGEAPDLSTIFDDLPPPEESPAKPKSKKPSKKSKKAPKDSYSLEGLNLTTPVPLKDIVSAVKKFRDGTARPDVDSPRLNLLLSGAPGSGKTAFVKYLAREVGAPLKALKASDLISRYSGETEQRIAAAFSDAKDEGAILFLDEIDSFLQDRAGASHSWEVSQVNELLQQMENFEGVMVGATNFAENLDKAVLRRFTYKMKLDYLTDEGKGIFFERYFKTPLSDDERTRLNGIAKLTPGDFRTVREELFYLADKQSNAARLDALEAESEAKGRTAGKIGF